MAHANHENWSGLPGNWDTLKQRQQFPSSNRLGIPDLLPQTFTVPDYVGLARYNLRDEVGKRLAGNLAHFFLDDHRFESVWSRQFAGMGRVSRFWGALTPDFSLYTDFSLAAQVWQVYRSRWVGRFWQECGLRVIPSVNWSLPWSFDFCFLGIQQGSIVALSVPDQRDEATAILFKLGFDEMLKTVRPQQILVYGKLPFPCQIAKEFPPDWIKLR